MVTILSNFESDMGNTKKERKKLPGKCCSITFILHFICCSVIRIQTSTPSKSQSNWRGRGVKCDLSWNMHQLRGLVLAWTVSPPYIPSLFFSLAHSCTFAQIVCAREHIQNTYRCVLLQISWCRDLYHISLYSVNLNIRHR